MLLIIKKCKSHANEINNLPNKNKIVISYDFRSQLHIKLSDIKLSALHAHYPKYHKLFNNHNYDIHLE